MLTVRDYQNQDKLYKMMINSIFMYMSDLTPKHTITRLFAFISVLFLLCIFIPAVFAMDEVPFEVVKTRMTATTVVPVNSEAIVINGNLYNPDAYSPDGKVPDLPSRPWSELHKGEIDSRIRVPVTGIRYTMSFWNVGEMGGEKGFIFKSSYADAKLRIEYVTGQAYRNVGTGKKFAGLEMTEKKDVSTPSIDDMEYDLSFSGGPYGVFTLAKKDGKYLVGRMVDGSVIKLSPFDVKKHLIYEEKAELDVKGDGFERWMEILEQMPGCQDPSDPTTDSGYRFNDYDGEIYIYPCDDEDAQMYAELDMVLHRNDLIITEDDSTADIAIPGDMTNFHMAPNSKVILNYEKESSPAMRAIKLISGKILRNVKRSLEGESLEDDMWVAAAGIKGTTYVLEELGHGSTLKVINGSVEFRSKVTGKSQLVESGEMITATQDGLEDKMRFDTEKELNYWEDLENGIYPDPSEHGMNFSWLILLVIIVLMISYFIRRSHRHTDGTKRSDKHISGKRRPHKKIIKHKK